MKTVNVLLSDDEFDAVSAQVARARAAGSIASKSLVMRTMVRESLGIKSEPMNGEVPRAKTCTQCGESKKLTDYYGHSKTKDGLRSECKSCKRSYQRRYLAAR